MNILQTRPIPCRPMAFPGTRYRGGFSIIECLTAIVVLGISTSVVLPVLIGVRQVRETSESRRRALNELQNIFELARSEPPPTLESLRTIGEQVVQDRIADHIAGAAFSVSLHDDASSQIDGMQAVSLSIRWPARQSATHAVSLLQWIPKAEETE